MATAKNTPIGFWRKLLATGSKDNVSHKRFISLSSFLVLVILAFMSAFGLEPAAEFIYIFLVLCAGESALTTIDSKSTCLTKIRKCAKNNDKEETEEVFEG